jgi:hypothetical protein
MVTAQQLEGLAREAHCLLPRVMPRKKRDGTVVLVLKFTGLAGRGEVEVARDATPAEALSALSAALVG